MLNIFRKKFFKVFCIYVLYIFITIIFLPYFFTAIIFGNGKDDFDDSTKININMEEMEQMENNKNQSNNYSKSENISDENSAENNIKVNINEENPYMESYIIGVVAAEMPASFEMEALKAQAVAARTYAYRQVGNGKINPNNIGQAYISVDEMKKRWGDNFDENYKKVCNAVNSTKNEIMVYNGEPILAAFHSTSGGVTESAENVWSEKLSYLRSTDSHEDENAPDFLSSVSFPYSDFKNIFSKKGCVFSDNSDGLKNDVSIEKRTEAGYVASIKIGKKLFKGTDVRKILSLKSANFSISFNDGKIIFTTKGYGHGAGMSQYGANFMAKNKKNYKEILFHYYYGVEFVSIKG